jgi:hypothetical protein
MDSWGGRSPGGAMIGISDEVCVRSGSWPLAS